MEPIKKPVGGVRLIRSTPSHKTPTPKQQMQPSPPAAEKRSVEAPDRHQPEQGQSRLGRDTQTRHYVDVPQSSRRQGLYITGIQGTGKSVLIENLIIQDIKQNMGVCLLDPHGDLTQAVLSRIPDRRVKDVIYLDINNYRYPFGINLFNCPDLANLVEVQKTIDQVIHVFEKLLGVSHETPLILEYLQNCTHTLIANPGYTMADIPLLLQDGACRKKLVTNVTDSDVQLFWRLHEQKKPADQSYDISSTLRRVRQFLQPLSRPIVGQSASSIDIRKVMDEGKILLVKLDTTLESITSLIGALIIALFLNAAKSRTDLPVQKRRQFNLYADEFQRFATEDFATLLEEARKFGISVNIAHQNGSQLETILKERARSVANLVVFKVNSKDGDELAGEFDITPQAAWEEEIEKEWEEELEEEWVEVTKPQRHERIEEQVEIEVEEDVKEIPRIPVEYLVNARTAQKSQIVQDLVQAFSLALKGFTKHGYFNGFKRYTERAIVLINTLLRAVMEGKIEIGTALFAEKIVEIVRIYLYTNVTKDFWINKGDDIFIKNIVLNTGIPEQLADDFTHQMTIRYAKELERTDPKSRRPDETIYHTIRVEIDELVWFVTALRELCEELKKEPIQVPTGRKQMVKRIQPHITYLTHESEKITHPRIAIMHPRKTISHPQRTYADMHNEVASQLTNLPVFTARVKITSDNNIEEHTIKTLDPKQERDRPLFGQALQDRIESIKKQNIQDGYVRDRSIVEEEIRTRQGKCSEPSESETPISRRPNR